MFHVYHSNQLDMLKILAAEVIKRKPLDDPFASEMVLVQSPGMAQWLQMELAQTFGIAANIEFPLPASFIWEMFVRVLPDIPVESAFSKASMGWKLMHRLPEMLKHEEFASLRHYLHDDGDKRKLFQLSSRVADLFDQYLVYRADWLNSWERGETIEGLGEAQRWQAALWRDLVSYTQALRQPEWHRANLYARFIQTLDQAKSTPENLPKRVFICGISALPPVYLQALQALGRHIDIHLLFTNPCRDYWGDIQDYAFLAKLQSRQRRRHGADESRGLFRDAEQAPALFNDAGEQQLTNPLLASWGKLGRDNLFLLSQMESNDDIDAFVDVEPDNLLHCMQHDLLNLQDNAIIGLNAAELAHSDQKRCLDPEDRSIAVQVCHSAQREVEVLQDHLLAMMEADPTLKARDIIVMVADIDAYAPFIQAVFANAPADRYLPFAISDRRASQAHPAIVAFLHLLALPDSRFVSEDVLALLDVPALASHFAIDESGLRLLRRWVSESGVRWGLDDASVEALSLPVTGQHTWRFGLQRMLLGYAMESHNGDWEGILPYDESGGLVGELAGHLAELLSRLNHWRQLLAEPRPLAAWLPMCRELLNAFFSPDAETEAALLLVEEQWQQLIEYGMDARFEEAIPVALLRDDLRSRLDQQRISQRFLAGQINFCTLMPMRSIPFQLVCLLGMNDGVYPRTLAPLGFDLMQQQSRKGDRSRRDDDRYLFLEAMISAQQQLYISYIGRAIQDNTERYPSVLVTELLDYIGQSFYLDGDGHLELDESAERVRMHLQHLHSRMPFAAENFQPAARLQSFAREWLPAARGAGQPQPDFVQPLEAPLIDALTLEAFLRFWRHPVRAWFHQRLGVSFWLEENELPDSEPFALDNLERYQINAQLLNALVEGEDTQRLYAHHRAAGNLPYGAFGELFWQAQRDEMQEVAAEVVTQRSDGESWEVNLQLEQVSLTGWLTQVQSDGLLRWRPGVLNMNDGLLLWLEHLVYCALGGTGSSRMFGRQQSRWCFLAVSQAEAIAALNEYVTGYLAGMRQPLMLLNKSGGAWLTASYDKKSQQLLTDEATQLKARNRLLTAWSGNYQLEGEGSDPYLQRLCRVLDEPQLQQITEAAQRWYLPVLAAHQDDE
ncbi:exodeoxyribonuclease V subunit gamma [Pantoea agglomerans]|uniref:exodeoxyribonuclease V subunit gamma n=1 Tax=Enterobacter agglomerans TaxID=549 RepID=UPI001781D014|nr:exodeoxyribonuclease V subunit gamma [Pantoea agglomerans]MBD8130580.1 exodeoxyribonuclease V subunit gamma [Pantoea agglomerans]